MANQSSRMNLFEVAQRQLRRLAAPTVRERLGKERAAMLHYELWCLLNSSATNDAIWENIKVVSIAIATEGQGESS